MISFDWTTLNQIIIKQKKKLPVCVLICLFNKLGRSKAFPQTSHGSKALSPLVGRAFGDDLCTDNDESNRSPVLLAIDDDADESPETDLCSSSVLDGGEIGRRTRDSKDIDKSSGESVTKKKQN